MARQIGYALVCKCGMLYFGFFIAAVSSLHFKLDNILVATDFSPASEMAILYAAAMARRHSAKLLMVHVVGSHSEGALMDGWRAGQGCITDHFIAGHLKGVEHELIVRAGDIWTVLSRLITEQESDLLVVGTRGRTGVRKLLLGSVAERIFRQAPGPVLTVGPGFSGQDPELGPERILVPTGFAPQSLFAVQYALWLAQELGSSLALLHVITEPPPATPQERESVESERLAKLRALVPADARLARPPEAFVQFGGITENILAMASRWNPDLIAVGLRPMYESSTGWAKAYQIVCQAACPVLTVRAPK